MKIVILGAGQVGSTVAHSLSNEENDITVVDTNANTLKDLQDRLDMRGVIGMPRTQRCWCARVLKTPTWSSR